MVMVQMGGVGGIDGGSDSCAIQLARVADRLTDSSCLVSAEFDNVLSWSPYADVNATYRTQSHHCVTQINSLAYLYLLKNVSSNAWDYITITNICMKFR